MPDDPQTSVRITACHNTGLSLTTATGQALQLAAISADGAALATGPAFVAQIESAIIDAYRDHLRGHGYLQQIRLAPASAPRKRAA